MAKVSLPIAGQAAQHAHSAVALPVAAGEAAPIVSFVSLGCAKNLVDSEKMLGQLAESGATISGDESVADTIVVNTCGFLESSRDEALDILRELAERKRAGKLKRIVVAGCLVQRDGTKLTDWVPEIDALVGVNNRDDVVTAVWRRERDAKLSLHLGDYHKVSLDAPNRWSDQGRLRLTPQHYAYVRVSEGCNQKCTFCTIPSIRGPMHSKTPTELVRECNELIADGAREIVLIGQDTTSYGQDLGDGQDLSRLLRTLNSETDAAAKWIRLMYVYPSIMTDEMIDAIAECERVVKYIDIPLQHATDRMLRAMHRRVTRAQTEELLTKLRKRIPGVSIRTTFIVGFPGESEQDFLELLSFIDDQGFDAAGAFKYSLEPETPAGRMKDQLDLAIKQDRYDRFMLAQQEIAFERAQRWVGKKFEVLVDSNEDERGSIARHAGQAPDVDATTILADVDAEPGQFVEVKCVDTDDYDLVAKRVVARPARATRARSPQRRGGAKGR